MKHENGARYHGDEQHTWAQMEKEDREPLTIAADDPLRLKPRGKARAAEVHARLGLKPPTKAEDLRVRMAHVLDGVVVNVSEWVPTCCEGDEKWLDTYTNERGRMILAGKREELRTLGRLDDDVVPCGPEVGIGWTYQALTGRFTRPIEQPPVPRVRP